LEIIGTILRELREKNIKLLREVAAAQYYKVDKTELLTALLLKYINKSLANIKHISKAF
jgi:hypothetical protein